MTVRFITGDCRKVLAKLPAGSVHCVVSSPPYWGLRDFGIGKDAFGLEPTIDLYIRNAVEIFRAVHRVLRPDGTLWLNLGDSYSIHHVGRRDHGTGAPTSRLGPNQDGIPGGTEIKANGNRLAPGLKPKDLCGIPWRVAFALQADGWWLRQDIIWAKPNPMPESVTDRCTKAHEYLFLLTKSARYYFDADAIAEQASENTHARVRKADSTNGSFVPGASPHNGLHRAGSPRGGRPPGVTPKSAPEDSMVRAKESWHASTTAVLSVRNKRSVWTVATSPFPEAHFATFPPKLIEPCILAGCPKGGTVLDPFGGAGTTGLVAERLGRDAILIEQNPKYVAMARRRIAADRKPKPKKTATRRARPESPSAVFHEAAP